MILLTITGKVLGWLGFGTLGALGFTHDNVTSIIVAAIGAGGLILSARHGRRLMRVEQAVNATKTEARSAAEELASFRDEAH